MKLKPIYSIGFLIVVLLYLFSREAKADIYIEVGPTNLSGDWAGGVLMLSDRFSNYDFGIGYISEQQVNVTCGPHLSRSEKCDFEIRENIFVHVQRIVKYRKCEFGIGPAYFQNTSRVFGSRFNFGLMLGCFLTDKLSLRIRHWSNAGSASPNLGQELFSVAWLF